MNLNQTVTDRIYNEIKTMIINLDMNLGKRIGIRELCEYFCVSQTPIREALNLLIKDELLEYKPRQGYYTVNPSYDDMEEIYELRELIECFSLKQGIKKNNIDSNEFNQLLMESQNIKSEKNQEKKLLNYRVSDRKFHLKIVKISANKKLYDIYLRIYPFVSISQQLDPLCERSLNEHIQIIQLILNSDITRAVNSLRDHINNCKRSGLVALKEQLEIDTKKNEKI